MLQIAPALREVPNIGGDRGQAVHALCKMFVQDHPWLLDEKNPSAIKAEFSKLIVHLSAREQHALGHHEELYHWVLQALTELVFWLAKRNPQNLAAEPRHPVIRFTRDWKATATCPDLRYICGNTGLHELTEIKTGIAGEKISGYKLLMYAVTELLVQHRLGNPIGIVQLRWLTLRSNLGSAVPRPEPSSILKVERMRYRIADANRYLKRTYNKTFQQVLDEMPPITKGYIAKS